MKRQAMISIALCLLTLATLKEPVWAQTAAPNSEAANSPVIQQQVAAELKKLRLELLQLSIEFQEWKLKRLTSELQQTEKRQRELAEQEQFIHQQLTELDQHAATTPAAEAGQTSELEIIRADFKEDGMKVVQARQGSIRQLSVEIAEQMKQEEQRLRELLKQLKRLRGSN